MKYSNLFSPQKAGSITLPNRIQRTSVVSKLATEDGHGHATQEITERYLIITDLGVDIIQMTSEHLIS
ncbi:hypothetical protein DSCO28_65330 [Desulfosarcina ovata subsp. sediminis]|uniref:Uncharacterized protein n=1 Tax=Desulfosarcina ovata subsp. sediminis TaxID=885957 RepID=A0A5K8A0B9_9BACT|nr:hypothetical protein [Desulfosarcina ovata]BBO85967.1 hypothetical protein DSCO28_65330 [Desulfosarcina ovata subsp. sediminis]